MGDALMRPGDSEFTVALRYVETFDRLAPMTPSLLSSDFRAHLRDGIHSHLVTEAERKAGRLDGTREVAVAFADLVDYTRLGESLAPEDVGRIAGRLARMAAAAARRPVVLVKTIGDAAMFVSPAVEPLIETVVTVARDVEAGAATFRASA